MVELTNVEIGVLVHYYEDEIFYCEDRLDRIQDGKDESGYWDADLRDMQIERLKNYVSMHRSRIKELNALRKEL